MKDESEPVDLPKMIIEYSWVRVIAIIRFFCINYAFLIIVNRLGGWFFILEGKMKKLFSFFFIGLLSFFLLGCEITQREDLEDLKNQIAQLESEMNVMSEENALLSEALKLSNSENNRLTFVIEAKERIIKSIPVNKVSSSAFDILLEAVGEENVIYSESEYGIFISAIFDLAPSYGSYIMISRNGTPIGVGISNVGNSSEYFEEVFEAGDIFTFESVYWDQNAKQLDEAISAFLNSDQSEFLNTMNYEYLTALYHLDRIPNGLNFESNLTQENETVKSIFVKKALGLDVTLEQNRLSEIVTYKSVFLASLSLMALDKSSDFDAHYEDYLSFIESLDVNTLSVDELAVVAMALMDETPLNYEEALLNKIALANNSPSLAYGIMGLIGLSIDPFNVSHNIHANVVEALLQLQALDGGFLYTYDSSPSFMRTFSSPQSFLALITLRTYLNQGPINPYLIP